MLLFESRLWCDFQDQFKYSYPPLPDDDFQSPMCENGPIVSEDESEIKDTESECKESLDSSFNMEQAIKTKKVEISEFPDFTLAF